MKTDVKKQMDAENPEAVLSEIEAKRGSLKRMVRRRWCHWCGYGQHYTAACPTPLGMTAPPNAELSDSRPL